MDPTIILTGLGTVVAIFGANIALIGWIRSDLNNFQSTMRADHKSLEISLDTKINAVANEMKKDRKDFEIKLEYWQESINREMKDFHGRLCTLEEKIRHNKSNST